MWHSILDILLTVSACGTLGAIGFVAAGECALRAKQRHTAAAPPPTPCIHMREALDHSTWAKVGFRCLDCGARRTLGDVYFGANNFKAKGHAA